MGHNNQGKLFALLFLHVSRILHAIVTFNFPIT